MASVPFDTQNFVQRLIGAGVPADQANLQTSLWVEIVRAEEANNAERFATKGDVFSELSGIRTSIEKLDAKIEKMDTRLDAKIDKTVAEAKAELVRWVVGVGMLQMALIAGLVLKLVPH